MLPPIRSRGSAGSPSAGGGGSSRPGPSSCCSRCRSRRASWARSGPAASSSTISSRPGRRRSSRTSWTRHRRRSSSCSTARPTTAGTPAFETAAAAAIAHVAEAPGVVRILPAHAQPAAGLGRRAHRLRRRLPVDPARRFAGRPAGDPRTARSRRPGSRSSSPAARPSTATSRPCPSPTSAGASSSPCRSPRSRCSSCSDRSWPRPCRSPSAARPSLVALATIYVIAGITPMSIFVLNLATLLGLGLGVDYSLLLTSRFREELASRADDPADERVAAAVEATVADRRPGGVLLRADGPARPGGPRPVRVHDPALGRDRRRGRRPARGVLRADAPARAAGDRRAPRIDALAIRRVVPRDDPDGPWARLARWVMRRPVAVLLPTLGAALRARPAVPPRPVQRAGLDDPPAERPVARRLRPARGRVRRGRVRADRARDPDDRPGHVTGERRRALRLLATPRGGPADPPDRLPRRRRPAPDRGRSTSSSTPTRTARATGSSRRPSRRRRRTTSPRSRSRRRTARTATRAGSSSPTCAARAAPSPRRPG